MKKARWIATLWGSRRFKRTAAGSLLLGLVIVGALHLIGGLNQPAEGAILTPLDNATPIQPANKELVNNYFHTYYPGRYTLQPSSKTSASLQNWALQAHQNGGGEQSSRIVLTLTDMPAGGVTEDSSYKLYKSRPELYQLGQASYTGDSAITAKRHDPTYESIVLWPHGKYLLTIALTASGSTPATDSELQIVLDNLQW